MNKIESITVKMLLDESPDTSFLGEYTDTWAPWAICQHCGLYLHHAERFNRIVVRIESTQDDIAYETECRPDDILDRAYDALSIAREKFEAKEHDCPKSNREYNYFLPYAGGEKAGSKEYQEYGFHDFKRMESLQRGDWCFVGIQARATISTEEKRTETLTSGGLWGIESDSDDDYFQEIAKEELCRLKDHLEHFNVDLSTWDEITAGIQIDRG